MRLAEHLQTPLGVLLREMDDDELEMWQVWEATHGPLGARRLDLLFASIAQVAMAPHAKKVPDIEKLVLFPPRDWDADQTAIHEQKRADVVMARMMRAERVKQRFLALQAAGRLEDWKKETGPEGEWLGPITDVPAVV